MVNTGFQRGLGCVKSPPERAMVSIKGVGGKRPDLAQIPRGSAGQSPGSCFSIF